MTKYIDFALVGELVVHGDVHYEDLKRLPAADVVEVVRCRDCKHYAPIDPNLPTICEYMTGEVVGDNYCSYGERRNE